MMAKYCCPSRHASRSKDAISSLHGPHQLAQTLMIRGLPRNVLMRRDGPFKPCSVASRRVPPIGTSAGEFANTEFAPARSINSAQSRRCQRLNELSKRTAEQVLKIGICALTSELRLGETLYDAV